MPMNTNITKSIAAMPGIGSGLGSHHLLTSRPSFGRMADDSRSRKMFAHLTKLGLRRILNKDLIAARAEMLARAALS